MKIANILAIAIILSSVTACQTSSEIEIGAIFMLTGIGSNWGLHSRMGADLAVEEINNNGGILGKNLKIVYEDNQADNPRLAVDALQSFHTRGIKIIIGPNWSPSGLAVIPLACQERTLIVSPTLGVAAFNEECDYAFNVWPHDRTFSKILGKEVYQEGYREIAILGSLQVWEQEQAYAVKESFESSGGKVVSFEIADKDEQEFRSEILKIKQSKPEAIVFANQAYQHLSAKRLRELGVKVPFYSVMISSDKIPAAKGALNGTVTITPLTPSQNFNDKFIKKYNTNPNIGSDTSYDAIMLVAQAMKQTGSTDPTVLKNYINSLEYYEGESGYLEFDGKGGVTKEPKFMVVKNNELVELS